MARGSILLFFVGYLSTTVVTVSKFDQQYVRVKQRNYEILEYLAEKGYSFWENEILLDRLKLVSFSWKNCGTVQDFLQISKLSVGPDPIYLPGNVNLSFVGTIIKDITTPLKVEVEVYKKIVFWIKIPCIDNVGSCTYEDLCQVLTHVTCLEPFIKYDIPCQCPMLQNTYSLPPSSIYIDPKDVPHSLIDGHYSVHVKLSHLGAEVGCYNFDFVISS